MKGWNLDRLSTLYRFSRNVVVNYNVNHDGLLAAGVAFYALLAIFPAAVLMITLLGTALVDDRDAKQQALVFLLGTLPNIQAQDVLVANFDKVIGNVLTLRRTAASVSGVVLLYAVARVFNGLHTGMDVAWRVHDGRSFIANKLIPFLTVLGTMIAVAASVLVSAAVQFLISAGARTFGFIPHALLLISFSNLTLSFAIVALMFALMYRFVPASRPAWGDVWLGALVAAVLWIGAKEVFALLPARLINFNPTYGTIGALLAFVTWIYITMQIVLLGAEISAEHARWRSAAQPRKTPVAPPVARGVGTRVRRSGRA